MGGRKQYLGGVGALFVCAWSDDSLITSAYNWTVSLHYTACVLLLLHCRVGWVYYTVPETADASEKHLGIKIAEDILIVFL